MHDMIDLWDIQPSGGDICGDKASVGRGLEAVSSAGTLRSYSPVEVLQTLSLLELRVKGIDRESEEFEQWDETAYAVDTSYKNQGFYRGSGAGSSTDTDPDLETSRPFRAKTPTLSVITLSIMLSRRLATTPPSGLRSTTTGSDHGSPIYRPGPLSRQHHTRGFTSIAHLRQ